MGVLWWYIGLMVVSAVLIGGFAFLLFRRRKS